MDITNILYTITQVIHNLGAVLVVGGSFFAYWTQRKSGNTQKKIAWGVLVGWLIQALSGAGFGTISYLFHGKFPEIHGIAKVALFLKISCTLSGFILTFLFINNRNIWGDKYYAVIWRWILILASVALTAAAFLRWLS